MPARAYVRMRRAAALIILRIVAVRGPCLRPRRRRRAPRARARAVITEVRDRENPGWTGVCAKSETQCSVRRVPTGRSTEYTPYNTVGAKYNLNTQ